MTSRFILLVELLCLYEENFINEIVYSCVYTIKRRVFLRSQKDLVSDYYLSSHLLFFLFFFFVGINRWFSSTKGKVLIRPTVDGEGSPMSIYLSRTVSVYSSSLLEKTLPQNFFFHTEGVVYKGKTDRPLPPESPGVPTFLWLWDLVVYFPLFEDKQFNLQPPDNHTI